MTTNRLYEDTDYDLLELSLSTDEHHTTTKPEFFTEPGTMCSVYEDEAGPVLFVKGSPVLRLDIQYVSNDDFERNKKAMLEGFPALAQKARENGFKEIVFESKVRALRLFVRRNFGFEEAGEEMRKIL